MGILTILLLVFFAIIAVLLILLVLIQNEEGDGLGGLFGGGAGSAFGSRSGNVLTRTTTVLGTLFLVVSLGLALLSRTPAGSGVEEEGRRQAVEESDSRSFSEWASSNTDEIDDFIDRNDLIDINDLPIDINDLSTDDNAQGAQ